MERIGLLLVVVIYVFIYSVNFFKDGSGQKLK